MRDLLAIALLQDPARRSLYEYVVGQGREVSRNEAVEEAVARLQQLQREGPTPDAFTFREFFEAPAAEHSSTSA